MKSRLRQFNILMIATLVFFSTTGVAIYHHICGCPVPISHTSTAVEPGHSCCSIMDTPPEPSCCTDENHDACDSEHHDRCKNEVTYLKAPIIFMMPVQELAVSAISFEMPDFRMPDTRLVSEKACDEQPYICNFLIPPRAGGSLVILLHSIKIPSPEDLS